MSEYFSFNATLSISGRAIVPLIERMGTQREPVEAVKFGFYSRFSSDFIIVVGEPKDGKYVGYDSTGYLHVTDTPGRFWLYDADGVMIGRDNLPQGKVIASLHTVEGDAVIQFDGEDTYDDVDTLYNFLIAARKVKSESYEGVTYTVPTGNGTWKRYPADKKYVAEPVHIELNIQ